MNIHLLEVKFKFNEGENIIYPVIIEIQEQAILVDCGYEGFLPLLTDASLRAGFAFQQLTGILITHHDIDHIGGLFEIKEKYPHLKIFALETEANYIAGLQKSLRLEQAELMFDALPQEYKPGALYFQELHRKIKHVPIEAITPIAINSYIMDGVQVLHTPGHMPWHISLYIEESKTLIAADAVVAVNDKLEIANPDFTLDMKLALETVRNIRSMNVEKIICYHGGVVTDDINKKLEQIISRYA